MSYRLVRTQAQALRLFSKEALLLMAAVTAAALLLVLSGCDSSEPAKPVSVKPGSDHVTFALKTFNDGRARHYTYQAPDGLKIRYFIIKSSDGVMRAAFDACDVCWRSLKGYYQDGDFMVCRNCGRRFPSAKVNEVKGGCNPAPLARKVEGDRLTIKIKDLLTGRRYFDLRQGG